MLKVTCPMCGTTLHRDDARAGTIDQCEKCGTTVRVLGRALPPESRTSDKVLVLEEAMRAAARQEALRRQHALTVAGAAALDSARKQPPRNSPLITRRIKFLAGGIAALLVVAAALLTLGPRPWELRHGDEVRQLITDADRMAGQGKIVEAFLRYQQALDMTEGHTIKSTDLHRAVEQALAARDQLLAQNRELIDQARTAAAGK